MAKKRLPPLSMLQAFEATARHASVRRAAAELNLTDGAVSRAVRELEADLGFALFQRGNRLIAPTAAAQDLAEEIRTTLARLTGSLERVRQTKARDRPLVLSCEPTFLIRWLIPRLVGLETALGHGRELRLISAGGIVPFIREEIDLAIRRADFDFPDDVMAEPFLEERIGPVCRPELIGQSADRNAIEGSLLHTATRPDAWLTWSRQTGIALRPTRELRFEHFYQSLQGAVAGAGFAIGPLALVADDLAAGALSAPYGFVLDGTSYVLMAHRSSVDEGVFRTVLDWLRDTAGVLRQGHMSQAPTSPTDIIR